MDEEYTILSESDQDGDSTKCYDQRNTASPAAPQGVPSLTYPLHVCRLPS
ncbi:MAG: hypothetical protein ACLUDF_01360 [Butyricicoccus sp.]